MLASLAMVMSLLLAEGPTAAPSPSSAPSEPPETSEFSPAAGAVPALDTTVEDLATEEGDVDANGLDPLEYSQKERQQMFKGGLALNIGPVMPWSEYGASILWSKWSVIQSLSLGAGDFEFSDNYRERNYLVKTDSQSAYYAARWFVLGFGPLYVEPFAGFVRWTGSIKPRGFDEIADSLSSSLNSRFDITGVSLGGNFGLMWIFSNGLFLDYNLFSLNASAFVQKSFTTNSEEAKKNVRKQLGGPLTMSNLQLRIGWSFDL